MNPAEAPTPAVVDPDRSSRGLICHVRARREQLGWRPVELAARADLTRQALHSVETGQAVPSTLVALRLARALSCTVEDLFSLAGSTLTVALPGGPQHSLPRGTRVQLAQVADRWLGFPLSGQVGWGLAADGIVTESPAGVSNRDQVPQVRVELFGDLRLAARSAVLVGCDPSLGLVASYVSRRAPEVRVLWQEHSSLQALRAVAQGEAHAAGIHLWEASTGISNLGAVARELPGQRVHLYSLWSWEQGLMVARGNPHGVTGPEDLLKPGLRLANREPGAGSRLLLDAWLDDLNLSTAQRRRLIGYQHECSSHLLAAGRVAQGLADAAPGPRSVAQALGLDFVPVQQERFDLVVPDAHLAHPAIAALIQTARQPALRAELSSLGGYDPAHAGEHWQSTA
jgi:putative molybdopterin biosynthesis protein